MIDILLWLINTTAGGIYIINLLLTIIFSLSYNFFIYKKGILANKKNVEIDLGESEPDILSNFIKTSS